MLKITHYSANEVIDHPSVYFDTMAQEVLNQGLNLRFKASGSSMYPFIQAGDILLVEPERPAGLRIGDIIFYRCPPGSYIVHRLVKKKGAETLITKGDNVSYYDAPFSVEQLMGRIIHIESRNKQLSLHGWLNRSFSWLTARLALGRYTNQTRLIRNLDRLWWLMGGRRMA
jgi:signal peptidase I